MKFILGKKLSMTQVWKDDKVVAVTPVLASPCVITQVKTIAIDGYEAVQLASGTRKAKNINKPQLGHVKNLDIKPAHMREFRVEKPENFKVGDVVSVDTFEAGDPINVTGTSKGKGFAGVVRRYNFSGHYHSHGNKDQERMGGSIGAKGPAHVFKGTRMGGRMGGDRVTTTNLEVISVDYDKNIIYVKGAVAGAINGLVIIAGKGEIKLNVKKEAAKEVVAEVVETTPEVETPEVVAETPVEEAKEEVKTEEVKA